jgi:NitT/TauT family transport system substrate-binding protein
MLPRPLLTLLAALLVLAACASPSPRPSASPSAVAELRPVRLLLGFRPDVQFAPFYLAQQDGYYADEGLEVTIEHADAGELIRLVADGQADFGVADATDVMIARTSGIPGKYIATLYASFPVALIGARGSVPTDPAELAGLRIGTPGPFGSSWHALLALLDAGGLTPDDVEIRDYPQFNQVEGLLAGDVDLITGFRNNEPLRLEAAGMATDLLTIDEITPLPGPGVIASDEILEADPDVAHAFAAATILAAQAVVDDPEAGLEAAIEAVPTLAEDPETALAVLEATIPVWLGGQDAFTGAIEERTWTDGYAVMQHLGFIDGSVPVEDMVDLGPVGARRVWGPSEGSWISRR